MQWRCPACQTPIRHTEFGHRPRPGEQYRCHVCRLELVADPDSGKLTVAPLPSARDPKERATR
jgi:rubredoxin